MKEEAVIIFFSHDLKVSYKSIYFHYVFKIFFLMNNNQYNCLRNYSFYKEHFFIYILGIKLYTYHLFIVFLKKI